MDLRVLDNLKYNLGDAVIINEKALDDSAFFVGIVLQAKKVSRTKEYDDLWGTKELVWEKVYKIYAQGKIQNIHHYKIRGKLN